MKDGLYTSYLKYFNSLTLRGYIKPSDTNALLVYTLICEILDMKFLSNISEDDYKTLTNCLYNLYGRNCLIPYPQYYNSVVLPMLDNSSGIRKTTISMRNTEDSFIRIV